MNDTQLTGIKEVEIFLTSSTGVEFMGQSHEEIYDWINQTLKRFTYRRLKRNEKSIIKSYIHKMTGYSRSQTTRLILQHIRKGTITMGDQTRHTFNSLYASFDIRLLATTDELHDFPNGAALKAILRRMADVYGERSYETIAHISVGHIYNLRRSVYYKRLTKQYQKTKPHVVALGERRKPEPNGKPGYIRVDTVHQGDHEDGTKGVYHINMVDEVTQSEFIGATEGISEAYLVPLLEQLLECFPFVILEFHSDNGSEYINYLVVELLNRVLIKLTKSRSRKSNDNALAEGKNGSTIRKWIGYGYIQQHHADKLNTFYFGCFNEYLNFHRPCAFATTITDAKGKMKKVYKTEDYQTPYDKLKSIPNSQRYLKEGVTFAQLDSIAASKTDNQMAQLVQKEREKLFKQITT
jgi:transposase InsO family protein